MGASGSAWIKPKKQPGLRAAALTDTPHPRTVRPGQRYFPLDPHARNRVTLRVVRTSAGTCEARREDASGRTVRLDQTRLLAADDQGVGVHYRFIGYAPRAGYRTHACVVALEGRWAKVVCPEWHPGIPITVAAAAIPPILQAAGSWVACKADLGATGPARTGMRDFMAPAPAFDPSRLHRVAMPDEAQTSGRDDPGEDVVLFASADAMSGDAGVYLTGHPPPTGAGCRAYLCVSGEIVGWRAVSAVRRLPNGSRVVLRGPCHPVAVGVRPTVPAAGVLDGRFDRQLWTTRSWAVEDERPA